MDNSFKIEYHLQSIRLQKGFNSGRALAEASGVSKSAINNIENGIKHPTVYTLCLLSLALDVSPYELFSIKNYENKGVCPR